MKCAQCGRENRSGAGFCAWCGAALLSPAPVVEPAVESTATDSSVETSASGERCAPPDSAYCESDASHETPDDTPESRQDADAEEEPIAEQPVTEEAAAESATAQAPAAPLPVGAILAARYEITELLASVPAEPTADAIGSGGHTYRAKDLATCPFCGSTNTQVEETDQTRYCPHCGAAIETSPLVTIVERIEAAPAAYGESFDESGRRYFVTADRAEPIIAPADDRPSLRLTWGRATDKGLARDQNEDYLETWYYMGGHGGEAGTLLLGLFVVADGLGGHEAGEVASRMATESVWQVVRASVWEPLVRGEELTPEQIDSALSHAVAEANQTVYNARIERANDMSTTLTLALAVNDAVYLANVGDSRAYLWNADGLRQTTKDHSLVQRLIDEGELTREEVYSHPRRNVIYRSIGDQPSVQPDLSHHSLAIDDRLIICSDGLWEMVHDDGLEEVLLSEADPQRACDRLVANANLAGGADNITVIIVQVAGI